MSKPSILTPCPVCGSLCLSTCARCKRKAKAYDIIDKPGYEWAGKLKAFKSKGRVV